MKIEEVVPFLLVLSTFQIFSKKTHFASINIKLRKRLHMMALSGKICYKIHPIKESR